MLEKTLKPVRRVLIITGSAGGGHVSAACALQEEATSLGIECKTIDALNASKFFRFTTQGVYEVLVRFCPWAWGAFYDFLEKNKTALSMHTSFSTANLTQLDKYIHEFKPSWIICTHDVALPRIALLRRYPHDFQLAVTITDIYPHILWIEGSAQADAEMIFVSCDESKENILARSAIPEDRFVVSGIPIGATFNTPATLGSLPTKASIPTVLITSGMIGAGRYLDVLRALSKLDVRVKLIFVCGRNEIIYRKLNKMARVLKRYTHHEYEIRGCVDRQQMAALLKQCTILVGKPGGLTMSESMAAGCPFVIYKPFQIPGQEKKNAEFLVEHGIGVRAAHPAELHKIVQHLLTNRDRLSKMRMNALSNGRPDAARQVLRKITESDLAPVSA